MVKPDDASTDLAVDVENVVSSPLIQSLSFAVAGFLIGLAVLWLLKGYADHKDRYNVIRIFIRRLLKPASVLLLLTVIHAGFPAERYMSDMLASKLDHALTLAMIMVSGWIAFSCVTSTKVWLLRYYSRNHSRGKQSAEAALHMRKVTTKIEIIAKVASFIIIVLTVGVMMLTFEEAAVVGRSMLASAGVAGIVIGFAAQKTIGNLFAGIQIAIAQPIRLDDSVLVEGEWGWVEEINLTYVIVRTWDKRRIVLPITYFTDNTFQNWTRSETELIGSVIIHADYRVPVDAMREELSRVLEQTDLWNGGVKVLQVIDTTPTVIVLRALATADNAPAAWDLRCFIREKLISWLQTNHPDALPRTRFEANPIHRDSSAEADITSF